MTKDLSELARDQAELYDKLADALDQQAAEIKRLRTAAVWHCEACGTVTRSGNCDCTKMGTGTQRLVPYDYRASIAKDAEIALLKEGRQLHDELVDHFEHVIAQAAAALKKIAGFIDGEVDKPYRESDELLDDAIGIANEALAALRATLGGEGR